MSGEACRYVVLEWMTLTKCEKREGMYICEF